MSAFNTEEVAGIQRPVPIVIGGATLHLGDCIEAMRTLPDCSVDSVVTDPPYGISFMGKAWDGADIKRRHQVDGANDAERQRNGMAAAAGKYDLAPAAMKAFQDFSEEWAREALRVLKPGGHLLSFSSARTYHRMVSGIEDAGFEIRDQIMWIFGSGFPKAEIWTEAKAVAGQAESAQMLEAGFEGWARGGLKPAHEPICVARKPFVGPVAANVLAHGTGAINIDACRVSTDDKPRGGGSLKQWREMEGRKDLPKHGGNITPETGRFPANVIHDGSDEVVVLFPQSTSGAVNAGTVAGADTQRGVYGSFDGYAMPEIEASTGSAARFFYCAKASRADRNAGLVDPGPQFQHGTTLRKVEDAPKTGNTHPTVKPTDLMAYLCRLVTPPGGVVLDPFMGSGSTGKAAIREGFGFIGIDQSAEYLPIAEARIRHEAAEVAAAALVAAAASAPAPQFNLFEEQES